MRTRPISGNLSIVMPSRKTPEMVALLWSYPIAGAGDLYNLNLAPQDSPVARVVHPGDGYLFEQGYVVASIGWQWDVNRGDNMTGLAAPLPNMMVNRSSVRT